MTKASSYSYTSTQVHNIATCKRVYGKIGNYIIIHFPCIFDFLHAAIVVNEVIVIIVTEPAGIFQQYQTEFINW